MTARNQIRKQLEHETSPALEPVFPNEDKLKLRPVVMLERISVTDWNGNLNVPEFSAREAKLRRARKSMKNESKQLLVCNNYVAPSEGSMPLTEKWSL